MSQTKQYPKIEKTLTANDVGATGSHQAGLHVPKKQEFLAVLPRLDARISNPTVVFDAIDERGDWWHLAFKYYNSKALGRGTRDEFRITRIGRYIRDRGLAAGDVIRLEQRERVWALSSRHGPRDDGPLDLRTGTWVAIRY